jgi:CCR4-NOT transcription complex subunit 7/8
MNQQQLHQNAHMQQHPNPGLQSHHGFGASQNNPMSLFGPHSTSNLPGGFGGAGSGLAGNGAENGLASQAAQLGFAHGALSQLHQAHDAGALRGAGGRVREVYKNNLEQEAAILRELVESYPYISMVCCLMPDSHLLLPSR